jgi:hypothetical protein
MRRKMSVLLQRRMMHQEFDFSKRRVTVDDIPALQHYVTHLLEKLVVGRPVLLSQIRPKGLTVDHPLRIAIQGITATKVARVHILARKDPDLAANFADSNYVLDVEPLEGKNGFVISKMRLSDYISEYSSRLGEEIGKDLERLVQETN